MRITMQTMEELREALDAMTAAIEEIEDDLVTWLDLDGEKDADSREQRRDAREAIESSLLDVEEAAEGLASLFRGKS